MNFQKIIRNIGDSHVGSERLMREGLVRQLAAQINSGLFSDAETERMRKVIRSVNSLIDKVDSNFLISESLPFRVGKSLLVGHK